jgi:hypothetical protein
MELEIMGASKLLDIFIDAVMRAKPRIKNWSKSLRRVRPLMFPYNADGLWSLLIEVFLPVSHCSHSSEIVDGEE